VLKDGDACLSSFGLVKEIIRYNRREGGNQFALVSSDYSYQNVMFYILIVGNVRTGNVTYRFGTILVNLLTGLQISPSHVSNSVQA